jgi:DNA polymerase-3 subunit gamma/tau
LSQLVVPLTNQDAASALAQLDAALAEGAEVSQLVDQLLGYFRDVMTQAVGCDERSLLYALPDQRGEVRELAGKLGIHKLLAIVQILDQAAARMRLSTHTRTLAEMALVRVCHLENLDELADLLAQLREQASGLTPSPVGNVKKNLLRNETQSASELTPATRPPASSPSPFAGAQTSGHQDESGSTVATAPLATPRVNLLTNENVEVVWKQALESLQGNMVGENAAHVEEVLLDSAGRLVVSFSNDFYRDFCDRPANRIRLEGALAEVCGAKVPLVLLVSKRVVESTSEPPPAVSQRQRQTDVASQPFVKKALELFEGDPSRVRYVAPAN